LRVVGGGVEVEEARGVIVVVDVEEINIGEKLEGEEEVSIECGVSCEVKAYSQASQFVDLNGFSKVHLGQALSLG
jgi:hypothetical protein